MSSKTSLAPFPHTIDRLEELQQQSKLNSSSNKDLEAQMESLDLEENQQLNQLFKLVKETEHIINTLERFDLPRLDTAHRTLQTTIMDPQRAKQMISQIDFQTESIKHQIIRTKQALSKLQHLASNNRQGQSTSLKRMCLVQTKRLGDHLMTLIRQFEVIQLANKERYAEDVKRKYRLINPSASQTDIEHLFAKDPEGATSGLDTRLLTHQIFEADSTKTIQEARARLEEVQDRRLEMRKLERSLLEVHNMFVDVQMVVNQQGEQLNTLADYVEQTEENTQAAAKTMVQAVASKRRGQRRKWIFLAILVFIIVAVAVSLGVSIPTSNNSNKNDSNKK